MKDKLNNLRSAIISHHKADKNFKADIARKTGVAYQTIDAFVKGRGLNAINYISLCKVMGFDANTGCPLSAPEIEKPLRHAEKIVLVGSVEAGRPSAPQESVVIMAEERGGEWVSLNGDLQEYEMSTSLLRARRSNGQVVACRVSGRSMESEYYDGDIVFVEQTTDMNMLKNLDHVVVDLTGSGEYTLKIYARPEGEKRPILTPINTKAFLPILAPKGSVLFGRVIGLYRPRV